MQADIARTKTPGVFSEIGGFGGAFRLAPGLTEPVLISGTDGVGTKLKLAFLMDRHDTVGVDCVAMCVNDILCAGASPLFFLDYIAVGKNVPERVAAIVKGVADGCVEAGCALIGGETAEMPGFYPDDEYDLAGFAVGAVERSRMLDPANAREGDVILGLPSTGVHSNGFSLVRKVLNLEKTYADYCPELGATLGDALLTPTRIYVREIQKLNGLNIRSMAHITGGGFYENIPRCLPANLHARIEEKAVPTPPIFPILQRAGQISRRDMFNTFNMGVGMAVILAKEDGQEALRRLPDACLLGSLVAGEKGITLC